MPLPPIDEPPAPPTPEPDAALSSAPLSCGSVQVERYIEEWFVYGNGQRYFKGKFPIGGYAHTKKVKKQGRVKVDTSPVKSEDLL